MAEGYASASLKPGVILVTSGPGSSNLVTPMLNALLDGTPLVVICGQVATTAQGTGAFQEIDIMAIAKTCTKWAACAHHVAHLPKIVNEAFYRATSGRPGPVLISVPKDVGTAICEDVSCENFSNQISPEFNSQKNPTPRSKALGGIDVAMEIRKSIEHIAELVNHSQRPIICAGHGVLSNEVSPITLSHIAIQNNIPVTTTLLGLGSFDETHDLALHMMGTYGAPYANYAVQEADLILVFGARLDERAVGDPSRFAPKARKAAKIGRGGIIQFDLNPSTVGKIIKPTQLIIEDLREVLPKLLSSLTPGNYRHGWLSQIQQWKHQYAFRVPHTELNKRTTPQQTIAELDRQTSSLKDRTILTTGVGQHQMWTAQRYHFTSPRSFVTSGSLGTMGFGLPAAIGVQLARPDHIVIDIDGDASFCMTMEELLTASQYNLPIKIIVFNNDIQGMISQLQRSDYEGRSCHNRQSNPDFVQLARSMGVQSRRCSNTAELRGGLEWLLECQGPALVDVRMCETEMLPIVPTGEALDIIAFE
jgi:acetolactate synthase-1/2/3 large subunit